MHSPVFLAPPAKCSPSPGTAVERISALVTCPRGLLLPQAAKKEVSSQGSHSAEGGWGVGWAGQVEDISKALGPYNQGSRILPCLSKNTTPHPTMALSL